jgi:hypothetical protein
MFICKDNIDLYSHMFISKSFELTWWKDMCSEKTDFTFTNFFIKIKTVYIEKCIQIMIQHCHLVAVRRTLIYKAVYGSLLRALEILLQCKIISHL